MTVMKCQSERCTVDTQEVPGVSRDENGNLGAGGFPKKASVTDFFPRKKFTGPHKSRKLPGVSEIKRGKNVRLNAPRQQAGKGFVRQRRSLGVIFGLSCSVSGFFNHRMGDKQGIASTEAKQPELFRSGISNR
jgi:hypothetical protein